MQNPFGAAKPREAIIAEKLGKTEEEVLKEEVSKEKLHVRGTGGAGGPGGRRGGRGAASAAAPAALGPQPATLRRCSPLRPLRSFA